MEKFEVKAYGTIAADAAITPLNINRRVTNPTDVEIDILFCGVCHSDLHTARNDWGGTVYLLYLAMKLLVELPKLVVM